MQSLTRLPPVSLLMKMISLPKGCPRLFKQDHSGKAIRLRAEHGLIVPL